MARNGTTAIGRLAALAVLAAWSCTGSPVRDDVPTDPGAEVVRDLPAPDPAPADTPQDRDTATDAPGNDPGPGDPGPGDERPADAAPDAAPDTDASPDPGAGDVPTPPACPAVGAPQVRGTLAFDDLAEVSGLAASRTHAGILWAHNDSGDTARFFAVDGATGATVARFAMTGVTAVDFEDIAIGPFAGIAGDALFLADVGDNGAIEGKGRASIVIHVVAEPPPAGAGPSGAVPVVASIPLVYPDGPVDCESFIVDPRTGDLYLVAKEVLADVPLARVFRKAAPHDPLAGTATLVEVARVPALIATGADIRADGAVVAIRTYLGGVLYRRGDAQTVAEALAGAPCELPWTSEANPPAHAEVQGEAIALLPDGTGYVTVSEGRKGDPTSQELHFWPLAFAD